MVFNYKKVTSCNNSIIDAMVIDTTFVNNPYSLEIEEYRCKKCNGMDIYIDTWINPNNDEIADMVFEDSVYCKTCNSFVDYNIITKTIWIKIE